MDFDPRRAACAVAWTICASERIVVRGEDYHFDDLVADNVFDEAGCFGERFRDFAGHKHHLLDLDLDVVSITSGQSQHTLYFLSLWSCAILPGPGIELIRI